MNESKENVLEKGYYYITIGDADGNAIGDGDGDVDNAALAGASVDVHLFHEGTNYRSYKFLGAHQTTYMDMDAVRFVVWAPNAKDVHLVGDFNDWDDLGYPMKRIHDSGVWHVCVIGVQPYDRYKYRITSQSGEVLLKADPYAFHAEERPNTASKFYELNGFLWHDETWLDQRKSKDHHHSPMSIYEVNLLSWRKKFDGAQYSYHDLAQELIPYVKEMNFTHIELMPIMEHPYDGSWGYQLTGYFAPTSRYGTPKDFMYFVDTCHQNGIGVILDWVPCHYCKDAHGLYHFDGGATFESPDYDRAHNDQWGTINFDYGRPEVQSFLISNLLYWFDQYHIDGIRMDAVAYMLYLTFGGKSIKNKFGGHENLDAVEFIKKLNDVITREYPDALMMAEESTAWPKVSSKTEEGGLGFNYKWNMGWMNDILEYMQLDPIYRSGFHNALTFTMTYAFSEFFVLPLSHDEVVHGKHSLLEKMPGSYQEKFANLRLLFAYMYAHPGKKLLFMGNEFGQFIEWNEWQPLDWHLLEYDSHKKMQAYMKALNLLYKSDPCFYELDTSNEGYQWIEVDNSDESTISFARIDKSGNQLFAVFNFTPIARNAHPLGVDKAGTYEVIFNTNDERFGGTIATPQKTVTTTEVPAFNKPNSIRVEVPALGGLFIKYKEDQPI